MTDRTRELAERVLARSASPTGALELLDQTRLPHEERVARLHDASRRSPTPSAGSRCAARRRSASPRPTAWWSRCSTPTTRSPIRRGASPTRAAILGATRPTAVNLRWALERGRGGVRAARATRPLVEMAAQLLDWARALHADDVDRNRRHGRARRRALRRRRPRAHPLQRRGARDRRHRHGARRHRRGASRAGTLGAGLGRRDAAAAAGRAADRLGAAAARHPAPRWSPTRWSARS